MRVDAETGLLPVSATDNYGIRYGKPVKAHERMPEISGEGACTGGLVSRADPSAGIGARDKRLCNKSSRRQCRGAGLR